MNYRVVAHLISIITCTVSIALSVSLCVGFFFIHNETDKQAVNGFAYSVAVAWLVTCVLYLYGEKKPKRIFRKEGLCVIGVGWLLSSVLAALPYYFTLKDCSVSNAFFESASGITTTGATVFSNLESFPHSLMFWRCLTQWIGGLGVVVLFVALLSSLGAEAKVLFSHESSGKSTDVDYGRMQKGARLIMTLYLSFSLILTVLLRMAGMDWFDAVCHMFTTISTGGFSTRSASIYAFHSSLIEWILILFMMIGGTSFILMLKMIGGNRDVWKNIEIRAYYLIIGAVSLLISFDLLIFGDYFSVSDAFRTSLFQVVSVMTTTGFCTTDFDLWNLAPKVLLLALMFMGGMSGSTSGGSKVIRSIITLKILRKSIGDVYRPQAVRPIMINNKVLTNEIQMQVLNFMILAGSITFISVLVLSFVETQLDLLSLSSGVFTCVFNVGPGFNELGPTREFSQLTDFSKLWLGILMIMGRLEFYAILVLFSPRLWKQYR